MATSPCGIDTGLESIKASQGQLEDLLGPGAKDALSSINAKAAEIGSKLNSFKPTIPETPNLQKKLQELSGASPIEALSKMTEIQNEFGPLVDDLKDILNEVSPDLQSITEDIQNVLGEEGGSFASLQSNLSVGDFGSLLSKASSLTSIDAADICSKCKNIEIKTLPDGTKSAKELPQPPAVPQKVPETEPVKPPQSFREQNERKQAEIYWLQAQNSARQTLLDVFKKKGKPPEITDLEFTKQSNRFWSNYYFLYTAYGNSIEPTVSGTGGGLNDWPWRETWAPKRIAEDPNYVGDPIPIADALYNIHKIRYDRSNTTQYTFVQATQFWYDKSPEVRKLGIGVGKEFFKEI